MFSSPHHQKKNTNKTTTKVTGSHHNYNKGFRMTKLKWKKTTLVPLQSDTSSKTGSIVVTGKSPDADANIDADTKADMSNGDNNNANANDDDNDSNDNDNKYTDVANGSTTMLQSGVSKKGSTKMKNKAIDIVAKNATTKMPGINNAATMTSTPIAATLMSGSVAKHDSSGSVAVHDSCQTNKGNKNVSIMSDLFFRTWN